MSKFITPCEYVELDVFLFISDPLTLIGNLNSPIMETYGLFVSFIATFSSHVAAHLLLPAIKFQNALSKKSDALTSFALITDTYTSKYALPKKVTVKEFPWV